MSGHPVELLLPPGPNSRMTAHFRMDAWDNAIWLLCVIGALFVLLTGEKPRRNTFQHRYDILPPSSGGKTRVSSDRYETTRLPDEPRTRPSVTIRHRRRSPYSPR